MPENEYKVEYIESNEIVEVLKKLYPTSVLLLGPPGVGKSESVRNFAMSLAESYGLKFEELTADKIEKLESKKNGNLTRKDLEDYVRGKFIYRDVRLSELLPEDLTGLPGKRGNYTIYYPFAWIQLFGLAKRGVLFIDEITNEVRRDLLSAAYKVILDRMAGEIKFSEGVMCIGAGNYPYTSGLIGGVSPEGVIELPTALNRRFRIFFVREPSISEWHTYTNMKIYETKLKYENLGIDYNSSFAKTVLDIVTSYLTSNKSMFLQVPKKPVYHGYPNPASWTNLVIESPRWASELSGLISVGQIIDRVKELGTKSVVEISKEIQEDIKKLQESNEFNYRKIITILQAYIGPKAASDIAQALLTNMQSLSPSEIIRHAFDLFPPESSKLFSYEKENKTNTILYMIYKRSIVTLVEELLSKTYKYISSGNIANFVEIFYGENYATPLYLVQNVWESVDRVTKNDLIIFCKTMFGLEQADSFYIIGNIFTATQIITRVIDGKKIRWVNSPIIDYSKLDKQHRDIVLGWIESVESGKLYMIKKKSGGGMIDFIEGR